MKMQIKNDRERVFDKKHRCRARLRLMEIHKGPCSERGLNQEDRDKRKTEKAQKNKEMSVDKRDMKR